MVDVTRAAHESKLNCIAALLGHSNIGFDLPKAGDLTWMRRRKDCLHVLGVYDAVASISGHLIESDEIERMMYAEANGWRETLDTLGLEKARESFPDIFQLYEDALQ